MEQQQPSGEDGAGQREDDVSSSALPPPPPPPRTVSLDAEDLDPAEVLLLADKQQSNLLVQIPVPEARVFNNLAEYYSRTFAKKKQEEHKPPPSTVMDQQQMSATKRPLQPPPEPGPSKPRRGPKRDSRSVLDKMAEQQQGPLSLLYRAMTSDSLRVRILVRRRKAKPLRTERFSWINGHLAAFDKHLNLALREAVEEYDHQLLEDNNEVVVVGVRKHTPQLFVRGDTVVLVSLVEDGGPLKESSDK